MTEIDFVLLWVDGDDPYWRDDYNEYAQEYQKNSLYFRDWENLHYLFRAFETFTPWVRKIHFVTYGHLPKWLDTRHPKLHVVKHEDIMPSEYLPTFNSNAIEANMHHVDGLSEQFVLFNDDIFLTQPIPQERFFKDNLPCDMMVSNALSSSSGVGHFVLNNLEILNKHFSKRVSIRKNLSKYFNYRYGIDVMRNIALLPWGRFTGFVDPHQPQPFLKSTFVKLWSLEQETLTKTSASKLRNCSDSNQYLFRYWQLASGKFNPISMNDTLYIAMSSQHFEDDTITKSLSNPKYSMVCLNDNHLLQSDTEFKIAKSIVIQALDKLLPNKSSFEL